VHVPFTFPFEKLHNEERFIHFKNAVCTQSETCLHPLSYNVALSPSLVKPV
jgi:hypothetical protein